MSQVSTPVNCLIGDTVSIRWSTSNIGTNTAIGYATNGLYLSSDSIWSAEDKLLGNPEFIYYLLKMGYEQILHE